jgi:hypothetical protein
VTVNYATANGTATAGSDYVAKAGTLTFAPGTTSQTITVTVNGDILIEANETFSVNLSSPTNATLGTATAVVTIVNDDGSPLLAASLPRTASATTLTAAELDAVVQQAELEWLAADPSADFSTLSFAMSDLEGTMLGVTGLNAITIDPNAAGWGWAVGGGGMDLRTVVLHELGHALGLDHDENGLMAPTLAPCVTLDLADLDSGIGHVLPLQQISSGRVLPTSSTAALLAVSLGLHGIAAPDVWIRSVSSSVLRPSAPAALRPLTVRRHGRR